MRPRPQNCRSSGFALLWCLIGVMVISVSLSALFMVGQSSSSAARTELAATQARYLAEAGLVEAEALLARNLADSRELPSTLALVIDDVPVDVGITPSSPNEITTGVDGLLSYSQVFRIQAEVLLDSARTVRRRVVRARQTPIFQYAMFYDNEMAFVHPAPMTIQGRVHCNSDIYIHSAWDLAFDTNALTTHGRLYGWVKDSTWLDWAAGFDDQQAPLLRRWVPDPFDLLSPKEYEGLQTRDDLAALGVSSSSGIDSRFLGWDADLDGFYDGPQDLPVFESLAEELFGPPNSYAGPESGTTLRTGTQGTQRQVVPEVSNLEPYIPATGATADIEWDPVFEEYVEVAPGTGTHSRSRLHREADLRVLVKADGTLVIQDSSGVDLSATAAGAVDVVPFYDARQAAGSGSSIDVLRLDVGALKAAGLLPSNGLVYACMLDAQSGTQAHGVSLVNGAEIGAPLTLASPNSVYIHGDYNTVDKHPASVIADSLNLLSNFFSWNKTPGILPVAANTTYNLSAVVGEGPQGSALTGGPENLARLHEDWSLATYTLEGSLACTGYSAHATGDFFVGGDYYMPPARFIRFDTALLSPSGWPPFTPMSTAVEVLATQ